MIFSCSSKAWEIRHPIVNKSLPWLNPQDSNRLIDALFNPDMPKKCAISVCQAPTEHVFRDLSGAPPLLLELCCEPGSSLSDEALKQGWEARRVDNQINLHNPTAAEMIQDACDQARRGRRVWAHASLPCTPHSNLQTLSKVNRDRVTDPAKREQRELLASLKLEESRKLQRRWDSFARALEASGAELSFEWPNGCDGWEEPTIKTMGRPTRSDSGRWLRPGRPNPGRTAHAQAIRHHDNQAEPQGTP